MKIFQARGTTCVHAWRESMELWGAKSSSVGLQHSMRDKKGKRELFLTYIFPSLLRYTWHIILCKVKVYNVMI